MFSKILSKKSLLQLCSYAPLFLFTVLLFPLIAQAVAPDAPTGVAGVRGNTQVIVSFTIPVSDGGSAILYYSISAVGTGFGTTTSTTTGIVAGLTNGTAYTFQVSATNLDGTSASSTASAAVTPATVPDAPTGVTAVGGNATATVSWTPPVSNGGDAITSYNVVSSPAAFSTTTNATSTIATGLTNGTAYTFTVSAVNTVGTSATSSAPNSVTPTGPPAAPSGVSGTAGNTQAIVSWTAPSNGGSAILFYTLASTPAGFMGTTSTTTLTATGLTNGTSYTFKVDATNALGTSASSSASAAVIPATVPGAPTSVSAIAGNATATVSYTAPASNGGSAITYYTITSSPSGYTGMTTATTTTATGLTNGTSYSFSVTATNVMGASTAGTSTAVTPIGAPGTPTGVTGTAGNAQATVSWTAPSNGGSTITYYTVISSPAAYSATTTSTSVTATSLTNGTAYTFTVSATNALGTSATSSASSAITPVAPTTIGTTRGGSMAAAPWTPAYLAAVNNTQVPFNTPAATRVAQAFIMRDLSATRKNDASEVMKLQQFLNKHGTIKLPVTGFFGPMTKSAVAAFQVANAETLLRPLVGDGYTEAVMKTGTGYLGPLTRTLINLITIKDALGIPS